MSTDDQDEMRAFMPTLGVANSIRLYDPRLVDAMAKRGGGTPVDLHPTTSGDDRWTLQVPYDDSTLSVGKACPERIDDRGVTAQTDQHVHLAVAGPADTDTDADADYARTIVTLGGPVTSVATDNFTGNGSEFPITSQSGYGMYTEGDAVHDAKNRHHLLSREEDIAIRTSADADDAAATDAQVLVQSDNGPVLVQAGGNVTVGSGSVLVMTAWSNPGLASMWDDEHSPEFWVQKVGTYIPLTVVTMKACKDLFEAWTSMGAEPTPEVAGWAPSAKLDVAANVIATGLTLATLALSAADWAATSGDATDNEHTDWANIGRGNVVVNAEKFMNINSGVATTIYGNVGTYCFSMGSCDSIGLVEASLTGVGTVQVAGGVMATLTALGRTIVSAEIGDVSIEGAAGVTVKSDVNVRIQADTSAIMNSVAGSAVLHGGTQALFAAGVGIGYGAIASEKSITVTQLIAPNEFADPIPNAAIGLSISGASPIDASVKLVCGLAGVSLSSESTTLEGAMVSVQGTGPTKVQGSIVLLG